MQIEQIEIIKQELSNEIEIFWLHFIYLKDLFSVRNHLLSITNTKIEFNIPKSQVAPNFFHIACCGMIESVYINLAKLYDINSNSKSIQKLLKKCNKHLSSLTDDITICNQIKEFNSKLTKDQTISYTINVIHHRRNKLWAHNDADYFSQTGSDKDYYLPNSSLYILIKFTEEVLDLLMKMLSITTDKFPKYNDDMNDLFNR